MFFRPYLLLLVLLPAGASCTLDLGTIPFQCNKGGNPECPDGYECHGKCCVEEGSPPGPRCYCGNNSCEVGEETECPEDCKKTTDGGPADKPRPTEGFKPPPPLVDSFVPPKPDQQVQPPTSFGNRCNAPSPCATGFICTGIGSSVDGFCTKECVNYSPPGQCTGTPTGTMATCILSDTAGTKHVCAFLCQLGTKKWPSPSTLHCDPGENPPGSQQHICMP